MNKVYTAPKNWDAATMGKCIDLPVREENGAITSCYELDSDDLYRLGAGGKLYFTVYAPVQPVVSWEIK
jgi:hypothetical protein